MRGDQSKTITVTPIESQDKALKWAIPLLIFAGLPYGILYFERLITLTIPELIAGIVIFSGLLVAGTVIHELLHGLTWALFARRKFKSIKFGIFWKALMPYCHCKDVLKLNHYKIGLVIPGLVLGIAPLGLGYLTGKLLIFLFGLYFTYSAFGDFWIIWQLRQEPNHYWAKDHPEQIGCFVYKD